jgi:hypothetical protein
MKGARVAGRYLISRQFLALNTMTHYEVPPESVCGFPAFSWDQLHLHRKGAI